MLVPPANFGIAEEGIYRCSKVETLNLSFIETLNLKTVLFIGGQEPSKFFKDFFNTTSIEWCLIKITDFSSAGQPVDNNANNSNIDSVEDGTEALTNYDTNVADPTNSDPSKHRVSQKYHLTDGDELMLIKSTCLRKTFHLLLNTEKYNILLVDRTSIIIGVLRKIQKWNISSIINEYRLFSGKNRSYFAETFLEVLDIIVEQERDEKMSILDRGDRINLDMNPNPSFLRDITRKMSNAVIVTEDDLRSPPEIPTRILGILEEAEANRHKDVSADNFQMNKSSSSLGIFGNRYRLAFNKQERGDYKYYKSQATGNLSDAVRLKIPCECLLAGWFKFQRDLWERENVPEEHNFYKEQIFI